MKMKATFVDKETLTIAYKLGIPLISPDPPIVRAFRGCRR